MSRRSRDVVLPDVGALIVALGYALEHQGLFAPPSLHVNASEEMHGWVASQPRAVCVALVGRGIGTGPIVTCEATAQVGALRVSADYSRRATAREVLALVGDAAVADVTGTLPC